MAGKLSFSLVSPEREVFNGLVDQVDAPGAEVDVAARDGRTTDRERGLAGKIAFFEGVTGHGL